MAQLPYRDANDALLGRLTRYKTAKPMELSPLGDAAAIVFKTQIEKTHDKFGEITQAWMTLVPEALCRRTSLAGFTRGTLSVRVDSSPHLWELKQLLLAGLEEQLKLACRKSGLRKVSLKSGR